MKIGLLTIHNVNNYGAVLQTLACQSVLGRFGEVRLIDYRNRDIDYALQLVRRNYTHRGVLPAGKDLLRLFPRARLLRRFRDFMGEYYDTTRPFTQSEMLGGALDDFDVLVAGSDQLWNPACISARREFDPAYFFMGTRPEVRRMSYASSVGGYEFSPAERNELKTLLEDFSPISVRESDTADMLADVLGRPVEHVVDPTLLLSEQEWLALIGDAIAERPAPQHPYILMYSVPKLPQTRQVAREVSHHTGWPVLSIDQGVGRAPGVKAVRDAGPLEFFRLFRSASFVVTDSFHGTCFSMLNNKPFMSVTHGVHSNRILSLLRLVDQLERVTDGANPVTPDQAMLKPPDVQAGLGALRQSSLDYLSNALKVDRG